MKTAFARNTPAVGVVRLRPSGNHSRVGGDSNYKRELATIGRAIRRHRKARGLSQEALAELAGHHPNFMGRVERGEHNSKISIYLDIAQALGVEPAQLFEDIRTKGDG
jgi:ribosome-binding protein aMBF1 (putative translation factor)